MTSEIAIVPSAPRHRAFTALLVLLAACSGGGGSNGGLTTPPTPVLTTVTVSLSATTITVGQTATASASGLDQNGASISLGTITWSTGASSVATVNAGGIVTGGTPGQTTVIASVGGKQGQASITVIPVPVASVTVTPTLATLAIGATRQLTATALDAGGNALAGRVITWTTSDSTKATVSSGGLVTAVATGSATITATSEGKSGSASITVAAVPVASVTVVPGSATVAVGGTVTVTATAFDASGNPLSGRVFSWTSSNTAIVGGTVNGNVANLTGVSAGTATITATSEGRSGTSIITVTGGSQQQNCTNGTALQLQLGEIRTLTAAQIASLCLGGSASAAEYALIPFNNSTVAASTTPLTVTGTNTAAILTPPLASLSPFAGGRLALPRRDVSFEARLRQRERVEVDPLIAAARLRPLRERFRVPGREGIVGLPATPTVGTIVSLNTNHDVGCSSPIMHDARVMAVTTKSIIVADTGAPANGFTQADYQSFGITFDTLVYALDTLNFGAPSDIDGNGRVLLFFTQTVNQLTAPGSNSITGGFFYSRDLLPVTQCAGSNQGEMFYLPVLDPNSVYNGYFKTKSTLLGSLNGTIAHEFQHMINAGRRIYVNNAPALEEVWLNEGLSHIAEELLYYRVSGNVPGSNIDLTTVRSTQAQLDAINTYGLGNLGRLLTYQQAPETNSPYLPVDGLPMRGAIWELLRYTVDRLGGSERNYWQALVNSTTNGQANFDAVLGDITTLTRDFAVAQFTDDAGLGVAAKYTYPSWNFRSIMPAINNNVFPLLTRSLTSSPLSITLNGGGAAYFRFRVIANVLATVVSTSSGQAVPSNVDFILVRTQ